MIRKQSGVCSAITLTLCCVFVLVEREVLADAVPTAAVKTQSGLIEGEVLDAGSNLQVFRGIPFAAPPVGDLRWKPPAPVTPWDGVKVCREFSRICPQPDQLAALTGEELPETSEDCLYLNVWTTAASTDEKLPVMVWIHGGGLNLGWGHQKGYDGETLAKRGVVLVSVNYRLGPFGFISLPELSEESPDGISGNYGFLDQVAALRWVQDNIAAFGGDPDRVTIFGESAGGTSVHMLTASPLTKGLAHRAIAQSPWVTDTNVTYLKKSVPHQTSAEDLGLAWARRVLDKDEEPTLERLRALSVEEIMRKSGEFQPVAVVDGNFLTDLSENVFANGKQNDIPFMVGTNRNEGTMFMTMLPIRSPEAFKTSLRDNYGELGDQVADLYPMEDSKQLRPVLDQFITDTWFVRNSRASLNGMANVSSPAFQYYFTRVGAMAMLGAHHAAEIPYAFGNLTNPNAPSEKQLGELMTSYWVNFATHGNPNGEGLPQWPQYDPDQQQYLELGDEIKVGSKLRQEVCDALETVRAKEFASQ